MTFRPHHVALSIKNTEESINWYKEKLGFDVIHRYDKHEMEITHLKLGEVRLELFYFKDVKNLPDYRKKLMDDLHTVGTKHLCIEVDNLDETVKKLKANGVEFVMETDTAGFGGRYIFFKDCNGILIEIYQP